jgi:hypothetical protein
MFVIKMGGRRYGDEELRAIGVFSCIGLGGHVKWGDQDFFVNSVRTMDSKKGRSCFATNSSSANFSP